ncbi:hypothetical protein ACFL21_01395 [Patescibacteria group bacterium]
MGTPNNVDSKEVHEEFQELEAQEELARQEGYTEITAFNRLLDVRFHKMVRAMRELLEGEGRDYKVLSTAHCIAFAAKPIEVEEGIEGTREEIEEI